MNVSKKYAPLPKENKEEGRTDNLLFLDNNIEFLKHFMNILLKNESIQM